MPPGTVSGREALLPRSTEVHPARRRIVTTTTCDSHSHLVLPWSALTPRWVVRTLPVLAPKSTLWPHQLVGRSRRRTRSIQSLSTPRWVLSPCGSHTTPPPAHPPCSRGPSPRRRRRRHRRHRRLEELDCRAPTTTLITAPTKVRNWLPPTCVPLCALRPPTPPPPRRAPQW